MPSDENITSRPDPGALGGSSGVTAAPPAGLPPVAPPSGKLMLQLFLVPGLIVAFLVVAWLLGGWLFGVSYSKKDFLDKLNDPNGEVRWRTAEQLAQVLLRDDALASDGDFARQLGLLLEKTRDAARPAEQDYTKFLASLAKEDLDEKQRKEKADAERAKLEPDRNFISFLTASLGDFMVPVGAPALTELATQQDDLDPKAMALRRRQAVWALANLGENLKRFDKLSDMEKNAVLDRMRLALWDAAEAGGGRADFLKMSAEEKDAALEKLDVRPQPQHADWLRDALRSLRNRAAGPHGETTGADALVKGVADALVACSKDKDDPNLRELSAFAMNFWRGNQEVNDRMAQALEALTQDDGGGEDTLADAPADGNENATRAVSKIAGRQIQYNAAVALARLGSPKTPLDMLQDMLDEAKLRSNFVLRSGKEGAEHDEPNEEVIGQTLLNALKAVAELHRLRPETDLSSLKPAVAALASSGNPEVRTEAEKTRLALNP